MNIYTPEFFEKINDWSYTSAQHTIGYLLSSIGFIPQSIIDIGGGSGAFAAAFYDIGIKDITVLDGDWVKDTRLYLPEHCYVFHDLKKPYFPNRKYDLAICCEVAEHLPHRCADTLVDTVCRCADICLWSAAVPGQGGDGHINEQHESYWEEKFLKRQRIKFDVLRNKLQHEPNEKIAWWYKQNYLIYAR
jgi:hypothetical protein